MNGFMGVVVGEGELVKALAKGDEAVAEFVKGRRAEPYAGGVQAFLPCTRSAEELSEDRRRAARQLGLFRLERESGTVLVGKRRVKAWRVAGTAEWREHARIVARLAEEFSGVAGQVVAACADVEI
jgi:hypothetical protein